MNLPLLVGLGGGLGMTVLFPCLAACLTTRRARRKIEIPDALDVLIPAHNEAGNLVETIESLRRAAALVPRVRVRVFVGADACTDSTISIAQGLGVEVLSLNHRSKWQTLMSLMTVATAPVVAWVDAGSSWPSDFLRTALSDWEVDQLGLAPAYRPKRASFVQRCLWSLEASLKSLENYSGGPVSVHGATVLYDRRALSEALARIPDRAWRNDDVLAPYVLRGLFPRRSLRYKKTIEVDDHGLALTISDHRRRLRMVEGNLEMLRIAIAPGTPRALGPGLVFMRRVFRIFWAWWVLFVVFGGMGLFGLALSLALALILRRRTLPAAFLASLCAPFLLLFPRLGRRLAWN